MATPAPAVSASVAGPTWGISGPSFLLWYLGGFAALLIGTQVAKMLVRGAADPRPSAPADLSPEEIARLSGGPRHAALVTVAGLYDAGFLRSAGRNSVSVARAADATVSPLSREALSSAARGGSVKVSRLTGELAAGPAMAAVTNRLAERGLLPTSGQVRAVRAIAVGYGALLAVGVARAVAGTSNGHPIGFLVVAMIAVVVAMLRAARVTPSTSRARSHLRTLRDDHRGLRTGGLPGDRALAAAVFGAAVLWTADPVLASHLGVSRAAAGSSSSFGGSSCGGGGCGGGGCGGGGCGGGGCGG